MHEIETCTSSRVLLPFCIIFLIETQRVKHATILYHSRQHRQCIYAALTQYNLTDIDEWRKYNRWKSVRTQIYKSQSSSENKEQTQELFFNAIIEFSDENLSLWESRHWVYKKLYCQFSETSSLRESLSSILRDSESTKIQVTYKFQHFINDKNSSHIWSSRNFTEIACNLADFIDDAWA